jgi:hypothetical protein
MVKMQRGCGKEGGNFVSIWSKYLYFLWPGQNRREYNKGDNVYGRDKEELSWMSKGRHHNDVGSRRSWYGRGRSANPQA